MTADQIRAHLEPIRDEFAEERSLILPALKFAQGEKGWLVGCNYRGRNGFGGMIRQANWFTITHGRVVKMDDYSAYRE